MWIYFSQGSKLMCIKNNKYIDRNVIITDLLSEQQYNILWLQNHAFSLHYLFNSPATK